MSDLPSDSPLDSLLIAQAVSCYYPISDLYAPTGRYLYYVLLVLSFITPRHGWLAHIFLGAAVAYAATASLEAFVLLSANLGAYPSQNVSIPYIRNSNLPNLLSSIPALITETDTLQVQPDYLELDIDAVTCVVVTAYLVGLPLQLWSSTTRSSRILHILIMLWNVVMLAGSISVLVLWPGLNVAPVQYRFCYAGYGDDTTFQNPGWENRYFDGSWNASISQLFRGNLEDNTLWWNLSSLCFYPCFNTSQILREPTSLKATVIDTDTSPKFHLKQYFEGDPFQPLIYAALILFTIAQLYLLCVGRFHICTERVPVYQPSQLWTARKEILQSFTSDVKDARRTMKSCVRAPGAFIKDLCKASIRAARNPKRAHKQPLFKFTIDVVTLVVMLLAMIGGPLTIIAFIIWIERYIHSDGAPNERPQAVGQWTFVVQIAVILIAALLLRLRYLVASEEEIDREIEQAKLHIQNLEEIVEKKRERVVSEAQAKPDTIRSSPINRARRKRIAAQHKSTPANNLQGYDYEKHSHDFADARGTKHPSSSDQAPHSPLLKRRTDNTTLESSIHQTVQFGNSPTRSRTTFTSHRQEPRDAYPELMRPLVYGPIAQQATLSNAYVASTFSSRRPGKGKNHLLYLWN